LALHVSKPGVSNALTLGTPSWDASFFGAPTSTSNITIRPLNNQFLNNVNTAYRTFVLAHPNDFNIAVPANAYPGMFVTTGSNALTARYDMMCRLTGVPGFTSFGAPDTQVQFCAFVNNQPVGGCNLFTTSNTTFGMKSNDVLTIRGFRSDVTNLQIYSLYWTMQVLAANATPSNVPVVASSNVAGGASNSNSNVGEGASNSNVGGGASNSNIGGGASNTMFAGISDASNAWFRVNAYDLSVPGGTTLSNWGGLVQASSSFGPTFCNAGAPYVQFTGTASTRQLMTSNAGALNVADGGGCTINMLARLKTRVQFNRPVSWSGSSGNARVFEWILNENAQSVMAPKFFFANSTGVVTSNLAHAPSNQLALYTMRVTNATSNAELFVNNALVATNAAHAALTNTVLSTISVGAAGTGQPGNDTDLVYLSVFDRPLTQGEMTTLHASVQPLLSSFPAAPPTDVTMNGTSPIINLDASSLMGGNGATVSAWSNVGSCNNAHAIAFNSPTVGVSGGRTFLQLRRASSQYLNVGGGSPVPFTWFENAANTGSNGFTVLVVGQYQGTGAAWERWMDFNNGAGNNTTWLGRWGNATEVGADVYNGMGSLTGQAGIRASTTALDTDWHVWGMRGSNLASSCRIQLYRNSASNIGNAVLGARLMNRTTSSNFIGRSGWPDPYLNANIAQFLYYPVALPDADLNVIINRLGARWNIATSNL
jgi:hypothetical protein